MFRRNLVFRTLTLWTTILTIFTALLAGPFGLALAQDDSDAACHGLSKEDCGILLEAQDTSMSHAAFTVPAFSLEMSLSTGEQPVDIQLAGSGAMIMAPALRKLMDTPSAQLESALIPALSLLTDLNVETIESMLNESAGYLVLDQAKINLAEEQTTIAGEVVFKNMGLYTHLNAPNGADQWFGEVIKMGPKERAELDQALEDMRGELETQLESGDLAQSLAQLSEFSGMFGEIGGLVDAHVTTVRGEDVQLHNQTMATFTTSFDLLGMLADPATSEMLFEVLSSPMFADVSDLSDLNQTQIQFALMTFGLMLGDPVFSTSQWVGLDDGYLHKTSVDIVLEADLGLLAQGGNTPTEPIALELHAAIEMDDFDAVDLNAIPVPTDYVPLNEMSNFLLGTPDIIEGEIELGEPLEGKLGVNNTRDVYVVSLSAGEEIELTFEAGGDATLAVHGPDGMLMAKLGSGMTETGLAKVAGEYLLVVDGTSSVRYEIMLQAQ